LRYHARSGSTVSKELPLVLLRPWVILAVIAIAFARAGLGATRSAPQEKPVVRSEKESRTKAQQKIDSQVLYEIYRRRGEADRKGVPPGETGVRIDKQGRALVDVRVGVTPAIERTIRRAGGTIVTTSAAYHSIIAWFPLLKLERLAGNPAVSAVVPAADAMTNPKAPQ
jgi:hypothetical protein